MLHPATSNPSPDKCPPRARFIACLIRYADLDLLQIRQSSTGHRRVEGQPSLPCRRLLLPVCSTDECFKRYARTPHVLSMLEKRGARKALSKSISNVLCACAFDELEHFVSHHITQEPTQRVNVTSFVGVRRIVGHHDARRIVLEDLGRRRLLVSKIA